MPWTDITRAEHNRGFDRYPGDLTDCLQCFLFQVDTSQTIVHEAHELNAVVHLLDAEPLPGHDG